MEYAYNYVILTHEQILIDKSFSIKLNNHKHSLISQDLEVVIDRTFAHHKIQHIL